MASLDLISIGMGLIPMNIALWVVYARNHLKWAKAAAEEKPT